jgi:AcrR family transcriptional regulator
MTKANKKQRHDEIFGVISRMFAEKGYLETTMRDIAKELNVKPPSLYNYFKSKEEALFKLINESMDTALENIENINSMDIPAKEKLFKTIEFYTYSYSVKKAGPILLLYYVDKLTKRHQRILMEKQRRFSDMAANILHELEEEGLMKDIPPKIALFAFFGMVNYTIKWYHQNGPVKPEELVKHFIEIYTKGILK